MFKKSKPAERIEPHFSLGALFGKKSLEFHLIEGTNDVDFVRDRRLPFVRNFQHFSSSAQMVLKGIRMLREAGEDCEIVVKDPDGRFEKWLTTDRFGRANQKCNLPEMTVEG